MISLNNIKGTAGARSSSKRIGRGNGSGKGTYSWRGCKGQNSRSGWGVPAWFEWGQTPLFRRMPKLKGFSNARFKKFFNIINLGDIEILAGKWEKVVDKETLLKNKLIRKKQLPVKLLGSWELKANITVKVNHASETAKKAVEKAGGSVEIIT